jgi:hypothetical protein
MMSEVSVDLCGQRSFITDSSVFDVDFNIDFNIAKDEQALFAWAFEQQKAGVLSAHACSENSDPAGPEHADEASSTCAS